MFDFSNVEEQGTFKPVPAGLYPAYVSQAEFKDSKAGARYLSVCFTLFGDNYEGRKVYTNFNLFHQKDTVKNIAMSQLLSMLMASGHEKSKIKANSEDELLNIIADCRCMVKVAIRVSEGYGEQNEIKGYQELDDNTADTEFNEFGGGDIPF